MAPRASTSRAFFGFNPYTEPAAERLSDFLRSVAQFAVGGTEALEFRMKRVKSTAP
jgi:hypothetical protein